MAQDPTSAMVARKREMYEKRVRADVLVRAKHPNGEHTDLYANSFALTMAGDQWATLLQLQSESAAPAAASDAQGFQLLEFSDVDASTLDTILRYCYGIPLDAPTTMTLEAAILLLNAAEKFAMTDLTQQLLSLPCIQTMCFKDNQALFLRVLTNSTGDYTPSFSPRRNPKRMKLPEDKQKPDPKMTPLPCMYAPLRDTIQSSMVANASSFFTNPSLLVNITPRVARYVLSHDLLPMNEIQAFRAAFDWSNATGYDFSLVADTIRFPQMSALEIDEVILSEAVNPSVLNDAFRASLYVPANLMPKRQLGGKWPKKWLTPRLVQEVSLPIHPTQHTEVDFKAGGLTWTMEGNYWSEEENGNRTEWFSLSIDPKATTEAETTLMPHRSYLVHAAPLLSCTSAEQKSDTGKSFGSDTWTACDTGTGKGHYVTRAQAEAWCVGGVMKVMVGVFVRENHFVLC